MAPDAPFDRIDYSRLIDWTVRLQREWPFFARVLASAPSGRVLDLGCGSGEHSRLLASRGFDVVGIDISETTVARARERGSDEKLRYIAGDIVDVAALVEETFGAAFCLGNTLPHVSARTDLERFVRGLRARLAPGGPLLAQLLNYERIFARTQRALPVSVVPDDEGDLVFLRLMDLRADRHVIFTPATFRYRAEGDPPLELLAARSVWLRGWRLVDLEPVLREGGFDRVEPFGTMEGGPFDPDESVDLILVAR
jgi:SAM-dependent methyltransferase